MSNKAPGAVYSVDNNVSWSYIFYPNLKWDFGEDNSEVSHRGLTLCSLAVSNRKIEVDNREARGRQ